jgi:hypothetical protein
METQKAFRAKVFSQPASKKENTASVIASLLIFCRKALNPVYFEYLPRESLGLFSSGI